MGKMSIILPAYNEEENINLVYETLKELLDTNNIPFELLFINDGSTDHTWNEIKKINDARCIGINFTRNFGKEAAINAGLKNASGDCVVVMDSDLQHSPSTLIEMYRLWLAGYDIVEGIKNSRGNESSLHKFFVKSFYKLISRLTHIDLENSSDYKLLDRKVVNALNNLKEKNRFFRALSFWLGFKQAFVKYDVQTRVTGHSKWSTKSLILYALNNITSFSTAPLQIVTFFGCIYLLFAFLLGSYVLIQYFLGYSLEGFTTVILLTLIIGSTLMISLGIIGIYIGKIYVEIKDRPNFIIKERTTHHNEMDN
ncbi:MULTISPECIES: glycosyltransferase family 2 protein [Lysinibacillus]|uniref:Glycosyltransferase n=1 Tax=Lysinibacillus antri TaxID=2498145 RepID=A0A3S0P8R1_9BACI|nr:MULTISPECIES: glycosyltransferase family 2 protein [Lysinibacillus]RUL57053.1 glycosyltransferase [Lysinibacillus antri]TSI03314.1 glycosyltransferase family 2 protein [Lysinibacillus sp. BW-2-10]